MEFAAAWSWSANQPTNFNVPQPVIQKSGIRSEPLTFSTQSFIHLVRAWVPLQLSFVKNRSSLKNFFAQCLYTKHSRAENYWGQQRQKTAEFNNNFCIPGLGPAIRCTPMAYMPLDFAFVCATGPLLTLSGHPPPFCYSVHASLPSATI